MWRSDGIPSESQPSEDVFNPNYLQLFWLDEQLWINLPQELQIRLTGIQHNAAEVLTSIDRFKALRAEAVHRGWPEHSTYP